MVHPMQLVGSRSFLGAPLITLPHRSLCQRLGIVIFAERTQTNAVVFLTLAKKSQCNSPNPRSRGTAIGMRGLFAADIIRMVVEPVKAITLDLVT